MHQMALSALLRGELLIRCVTEATTGAKASDRFGGPPACWLIDHHLSRFVIGQDPRDTSKIWDQMFRASMFYGRKGLPIAAISAVDLALWDLVGKLRGEPVYKMIGGATKDYIPFYMTGPLPIEAKRLGWVEDGFCVQC